MQKCIMCLEEGVRCSHECCTHKVQIHNYTNTLMRVVSIAIISIVGRFRITNVNN